VSAPPEAEALAKAVETAPRAETEAAEEGEGPLPSGPVLLDTNVLVYATNEDSPFHAQARRIVERALSGELPAAITPQVLAEYYAVVTDPRRVEHPLTPAEARRQVEALLAGAIRLLPLNEGTSRRLVELGERYGIRAQEIYDAQVVAAMLEGGIPQIWTANVQDFERYREIEVHNPFR